MLRQELIRRIASEACVSQANCEKCIDALIKVMTEQLVEGEKIVLSHFVSFTPAEMPARTCKHPKTGELTTFPPVRYIKCKVSKTLRKAINHK